MFSFFKTAEPDPKQTARELYDKVIGLSSDSHDARSARLRLGMLIRAHVDKTFVAGAEQTAQWQEQVAQAIVSGEEKPPLPQASEYQQVKSGSKNVWVYMPQEDADAFFALGVRYQRVEISAQQAISQAQTLMDRICFQDLQLETPFEILQFLRSEVQAEQGLQEPPPSDADGAPSEAQRAGD